MPQVNKQALSQFIRTGCQRQLALNLFPDNPAFRAERNGYAMPYPQSPRPGIVQIQQAGDEWQAEKLNDLTQTFGTGAVIGNPHTTPSGQVRYNPIPLAQALAQANPVCFLVEAQFPIGPAFQNALGIAVHATTFDLQYADARPDLIEIVSSGVFTHRVTPDGTVELIPGSDQRLQLRVIDIKMTARASQSYFAEVAYYSMALAGWLADEQFDDQFVVVADGAVWPGSHEASELVRLSREILDQGGIPTLDQLREFLQGDLEAVPFDVFSLSVRRFLQTIVPAVLTRVQNDSWRNLEWHVDNRCSFCEYIGEPRPPNPSDPHASPHPDHCLPSAVVQDHLSRVAFVSSGARQSLTHAGVSHVAALAVLPSAHPAFDSHQTLRATRTVVSSRALSLQSNQTSLAPHSGTSASMPRWADLHIYLSVDFDMGSAITVAFGWKAFWYEPRPPQSPLTGQRQPHQWPPTARVVVDRDLNTERQELLAFLQEIHNILQWCVQQDQQTLANPALGNLTPQQRQAYRTTVQVYLWDQLQHQHLTRIIGRHLHAILQRNDIGYLAWLFPPEELLDNPELCTRRSPITVVRDVVRSQLAAPIAHYYTLFDIARLYHEPSLPPNIAAFSIHPLFSVPLSDQIPSERAHEIWGRLTAPRHWQQQLNTYAETVRKRLSALETVTRRLEADLGNQLSQVAPVISVGPPQRQARLSIDGQLWYAFAKLNEALQGLEVHQARAMPPHERAARFRSARLTHRLVGPAEQAALAQMQLQPAANRRVYELGGDSTEIKAKVGDFAFALAPATWAGFCDEKLARVVWNTPLRGQYEAQFGNFFWRILMEDVTGVTVVGLDRNQRLIALDVNARFPTVINDLHTNGVADFDHDVMLDPVHHDFFTRKLLEALRAIGNPTVAGNDPLIRRATGQVGPGSHRTAHTPPADFLWNGQATAATVVARNLGLVQNALATHGLDLNPTQWDAWSECLTHRGRLVWGPPGTGKSRTVRAIVDGAIVAAFQARRAIRILVTASTYNAIDNVLLDIAADLQALVGNAASTYRLRSHYQTPPGNIAPAIDVDLNRSNPSQVALDLRSHLLSADRLIVVGAPPEQIYNLLVSSNNQSPQQECFDLIVIDEASQMDVAHAILPLCAIASDGALVLAGDPLQLPPIHQAEAPKDLENQVGCAYAFFQNVQGIPQCSLGINYRSNDTIVRFARESGYDPTLLSFSPNLRIRFVNPLPTQQPPNWPPSLPWIPEWARLLDPDEPAVCFVYDDGRSSQRNFFEADAVAAMLFLLHGRISNQLAGENDPVTGTERPLSNAPYSAAAFWERTVGVVTPHRAQQGLIVSRLHDVFQASGAIADAIRDAVDTVERFQGQQRDIIIASYALGDPDQIEDEEDFLMSLNRFNVMASRARAKLIVLVSREVVDHLSSELTILRESRLLKFYAESFCNHSVPLTLGYIHPPANATSVAGVLRWHT